ncbi:MAG: hypothetical protein K2R98_10220 [Gemmataceae bacterium]|nr:hypothetical protein [Gemmataceae bacterium]
MAAGSLEDRVRALEIELARLKTKVEPPKPSWIDSVWGVFADDPDFLDAMRLGREYREAQRPKPS